MAHKSQYECCITEYFNIFFCLTLYGSTMKTSISIQSLFLSVAIASAVSAQDGVPNALDGSSQIVSFDDYVKDKAREVEMVEEDNALQCRGYFSLCSYDSQCCSGLYCSRNSYYCTYGSPPSLTASEQDDKNELVGEARQVEMVEKDNVQDRAFENYVKDKSHEVDQQCKDVADLCSDSSPCCPGFECLTDNKYPYCWFTRESNDEADKVDMIEKGNAQDGNEELVEDHCRDVGESCSETSLCCSHAFCLPYSRYCISYFDVFEALVRDDIKKMFDESPEVEMNKKDEAEERNEGPIGAPESDMDQVNPPEIVFVEKQNEASTTCVDYGGVCNTSTDCCSIYSCSSLCEGCSRFCAF